MAERSREAGGNRWGAAHQGGGQLWSRDSPPESGGCQRGRGHRKQGQLVEATHSSFSSQCFYLLSEIGRKQVRWKQGQDAGSQRGAEVKCSEITSLCSRLSSGLWTELEVRTQTTAVCVFQSQSAAQVQAEGTKALKLRASMQSEDCAPFSQCLPTVQRAILRVTRRWILEVENGTRSEILLKLLSRNHV